MLKTIKQYILNRAFKNNSRVKRFLNLDLMQDILILFDYKDLMEVYLVAKDLEKKGKRVVLWSYKTSESADAKMDPLSFKARIITKEELSLFFILKSTIVEEYGKLKYDTLLCFSELEDVELEYLLAMNTAHFCMGMEQHNSKIFDFTVHRSKGKTILETYDQMKLYLQNIKP